MGGEPGKNGQDINPALKHQLQSQQFNNIATGKPDYGKGDMALAALSNISSGRGIIPALIAGFGQVYMANKENKALQQQLIQKEMLRRGGQQSLSDMAGIDPRYSQGLVSGEDATMKQAIELQGLLNSGANNNKLVEYLHKLQPTMPEAPQIQGAMPVAAQNAYTERLYNYGEKLPGMQQTGLENQYLQGTLPGRVSGTNAENKAKTLYAVPQAKADLTGKNLSNQGQAIDNQYAPQIKQGTIQNQQLNAKQMQANIQHKAAGQALGLTLQKLQNDYPDPVQFRGMGMDLLRRSNLPPEGIKAGMDSIDQMIIMKRESDKARAVQAGQQVPGSPQKKPGLFGFNP